MKLSDSGQLRVLHVITGLGTGGAEMMLFKLLDSMQSLVHSKVIVLMGRGALSRKVEALGVEVEYLSAERGQLPRLRAVLRMLSASRQFAPDVLQGWMYHGNLAAWLIHKFAASKAMLFWNVRQTLYNLNREKHLTRSLIRLSRWFSSSPRKIIYNSILSADQHEAFGYPRKSRVVISNGFDLQKFRPNETARGSVNLEFGLSTIAPLVLHVARYHPMKDHVTFLLAVKGVLKKLPGARFLLVGNGATLDNEELAAPCSGMGLPGAVILAGERDDLPRLMAAADLVVLSSAWGEGFPNVIGEAMACGTPCVATDVGDSGWVLDGCGRVVPPQNPEALADGIIELLSDDCLRNELGKKARQRVQDVFSIDRVSKDYLGLYQGKAA